MFLWPIDEITIKSLLKFRKKIPISLFVINGFYNLFTSNLPDIAGGAKVPNQGYKIFVLTKM